MEMWAQLRAELCSQLMDALQSPRVAPFIPVPTDGAIRSQLVAPFIPVPTDGHHSFRSQLVSPFIPVPTASAIQSQLMAPSIPVPSAGLPSVPTVGSVCSDPTQLLAPFPPIPTDGHHLVPTVHSGPNWWLRSFWSHPAPRFGVGHVGLRGRIPTAGEELEEQRPPQPVPQ